MMNKHKLLAGFFAVFWLVVSVVSWSNALWSVDTPTSVIATVASLAFGLYAFRGASKQTSMAGKILIAASVLMLVAQLVNGDPELLSADTALRTLVLVSGLLLERISPHQQLYPWMFLMIATKVELVIIGAFISAAGAISGTFPLEYWWSIVALMLLGVPLLAGRKKTAYRSVVILTSLVATILVADYMYAVGFNIASFIGIGAVLWPLATERLIGYRAFIKKVE